MTSNPQPRPQAAGAFIALGAIIGGVVGTIRGEPSLGLLAGTGAGIAVALLFWLIDRRRML